MYVYVVFKCVLTRKPREAATTFSPTAKGALLIKQADGFQILGCISVKHHSFVSFSFILSHLLVVFRPASHSSIHRRTHHPRLQTRQKTTSRVHLAAGTVSRAVVDRCWHGQQRLLAWPALDEFSCWPGQQARLI